MKKRIHVNQHNIKYNQKHGPNKPVAKYFLPFSKVG